MNWLFGKINDVSDVEYREIYLSLSSSRRLHIDKMKKEEARKRSLLATYLLDKLTSELGIDNAAVECDENGKPHLNDDGVFISISHSNEMVACAVDNEPIGIDVEKIRSVNPKLVERICTKREREYITCNNITQDDFNTKFFEIWTAKEAYFKKYNKQSDISSIETLDIKKTQIMLQGYCVTII